MGQEKVKRPMSSKKALKKVRKMIRREVKAQLGGLRDSLSGEFQVSIGEEIQRRTTMPFIAVALTDAKAGEQVEVRPLSEAARY